MKKILDSYLGVSASGGDTRYNRIMAKRKKLLKLTLSQQLAAMQKGLKGSE